MKPKALLILMEGAGVDAKEWPIHKSTTYIGRWEEAEVVLPDREVSRKHAQIRQDGTAYIVVDLDSRNGTFINGMRLQGARKLRDGDEILIAPRYQFRFVDNEATAAVYRQPRGIRIDPTARMVEVAGKPLASALAPTQFALLELLMSDYGRVFSRDEIAKACYGADNTQVSDQAIDGIVRRLRTRLAEADPDNEYIRAVRGHGFQVVA